MDQMDLIEMYARVLEYEHALEHIAEEHKGDCPSCRLLARSALDGVNREMCIEMAKDYYRDEMYRRPPSSTG